MSNVLICTLRFDNVTWGDNQHIFLKGEDYTNNPKSSTVFKRSELRMKLKAAGPNNNSCSAISEILGVKKIQDETDKLESLAKSLVKEGYKNEYIEDDITNKDWGYLIDDVYDILLSNIHTDVVSVIPSLKEPKCIYLQENGIKAYAISILSVDRGEGGIFYSDWSDALINDFSEEGDNVIIALHGSTDYKDPKMINVYLEKESEELSKKYNRSIRLHVFNHQEGSGYIKPTLLLKSLPEIWNKLDSYGREQTS